MNDFEKKEEQSEYGTYRVIENHEYDVYTAEPNSHQDKKPTVSKTSAVGIGAALLFLATKGKTILLALFSLFKYSKFLGTGISMFIMIWSYSMFYGWKYAVGIVLMIAVHEWGHLVFAKAVGMPVSAPVFIPFVGAFISMKEAPKDAWQEAVVAIGGPFFGLVAGIVALYWGIVNGSGLVQAVAYFSFFITLFNMIPVSPLDGGRIVTALSPWVWGAGLVIMAIASWHTMNPLMWIILIFGGYRAWQTWNLREDRGYATYFAVSSGRRWFIGLAYGLITAISGFGVYLFTGV